MAAMFGVNYVVVRASSELDVILVNKIAVGYQINSEYGADKFVVCAKGVNKNTVKRIALSIGVKEKL